MRSRDIYVYIYLSVYIRVCMYACMPRLLGSRAFLSVVCIMQGPSGGRGQVLLRSAGAGSTLFCERKKERWFWCRIV